EEEWQQSQGATVVSYTLQRAGTYHFVIHGSNNDGLWNNQARTLEIVVLPPPWRSTWAYALYIVAIGLLIVGGWWFIRLRHRLQLEQIAKDQQEALHQAKLRFYTNVTHEFRTPLTLILGPVEELLQEVRTVGGQRRLLSVQHHAQRLLHLVNQLLTFRKLETDHTALRAAPGNIVRFLEEVHLSFREHARLRQIGFHFDPAPLQITCWYDRDKLEKVFSNLLANAFKFTPKGGSIHMTVRIEGSTLKARITDSGPGISTGQEEQVFIRYFEENANARQMQEATGLGLALCRQLVELHYGKIRVVPESKQGACFEVSLPLGDAHLSSTERIENFHSSEAIQPYLQKAASEATSASFIGNLSDETPSILIVEDNSAVRDYISSIFAGQCKLITADNGQKGLNLARKHSPDLIISDVMMPEMDGLSLCRELKSGVETSHIPIILLTARTGQIFRVEGLETGADAYISKPFSPYELRLRVRNLLQARQRIRERFAQVVQVQPTELALTSADEDFLLRAMETVEKYIDNPDFVAEQFAREMAVSRALLFTKLKAITDQTPNNFVKTIRLKRAAQYLEQSDLGIAEIAYQVGFRDARYFRKCFHKQWNKSPSAYRQEKALS
ncbi:MAG: response regulator, partial [Bacteroidota bacterium]